MIETLEFTLIRGQFVSRIIDKDNTILGAIVVRDGIPYLEANLVASLNRQQVKALESYMGVIEYQIKTGIRQKDGRLHNA